MYLVTSCARTAYWRTTCRTRYLRSHSLFAHTPTLACLYIIGSGLPCNAPMWQDTQRRSSRLASYTRDTSLSALAQLVGADVRFSQGDNSLCARENRASVVHAAVSAFASRRYVHSRLAPWNRLACVGLVSVAARLPYYAFILCRSSTSI